ncbi:DUF3488 and transglutaminase-like domain-containing protein [Actinotalea sp. K2]|uniref:DUF3488 and transglutaminase-like domain-containing protein n=1 Tax=Actinotalea sp. K2 TaxID=2939438 RepID=UPI002016AEF4|nr:DUF3488 and transglutaminase-like domain-containing protein [Actinotalea sp. K2]MCL3860133.1 DUF3488 and transglutaminase-like domain-containing protein [Actinotalea sp. K2]
MSAHPVSGAHGWAATGALATGVASGLWAMTYLVAPGRWVGVSLMATLVLLLVTTATRRAGASRLVPTAWATLVAALCIVSVYGSTGTGLGLPVPTRETMERLSFLVRGGVRAVADGVIPVEPVLGLELLLVGGVVLVVLLGDLVALGLGRAGLSGLAIVGLWLPTIFFERAVPPVPFVLAGLSYLVLLHLTRPRPPSGRRSTPRDLRVTAAAAVVLTVVALASGPIASGVPFYRSVTLPATWGPGAVDGPLRLSTDLDMRASLAARSDQPILSYTTQSRTLGPLRMYTMTDFDGAEWNRAAPEGDLARASGVLWPGGAVPVPQDAARVSVQVGNLDQDRLPIPTDPRQVEIDGNWLYDASRDEVLGVGTTTRDISYDLWVSPRSLTADDLRADSTAGPLEAREVYTEVPESPFAQEIRAQAEAVMAGSTTDYDRALALQSWFRNFENFTYSATIPPAQTDDAVWDFLTQRTGYCVQYATAMTVMARTAGIPARLAVGFLPGTAQERQPSSFVVTGRHSHAWPELWFAEAGWVRFEPTPAVQTGAPPLWADPYGGAATPEDEPTAAPQTETEPLPEAAAPESDGSTGGSQVGIGTASVPLLLVVAVTAVIAVLLVLGISLLVRRRLRQAAPALDPVRAWSVLRTRLAGHGVGWSDATTPRQAAEIVRNAYRAGPRASADGRGPGLRSAGGEAVTTLQLDDATTLEATRALEQLVAAFEAEQYAPTPTAWSPQELGGWVDAVEAPMLTPEQHAGAADGRG